jgi:hypothetical protein
VLLALVSLSGQYAAGQALGFGRGPQQPLPQQDPQANPANKALEDAKASADKADAAKKAVLEANDAVHAAQKEVDAALKDLKKIEDDTIDAEPGDSPLGKARDAYRAAERKYHQAQTAALADPTYKERYAEAKEADDGAASLVALRKELDATPSVAEARAEMQASKQTFDSLKTKLLARTADWVKAGDSLKEKRTALDDTKRKYKEAQAEASKTKAAAARDKATASRMGQMRGGTRGMMGRGVYPPAGGSGPMGSAAPPGQ